MDILNSVNSREELLALPEEWLPQLSGEIRQFIIESVSKTGGHLASNLGTVELTLALHRVYDFERDRLVFDVGHQCYTHKLLTGRREGFSALRQTGGLSGFPKPTESESDAFIAGHASNSVSVALGMAKARTLLGESYDVVALIGDGALTGGLAYEGLCNAGQSGEPMVVILNDNAMSIDTNVGGMAKLLSRMRVRPGYLRFKRWYRATVGRVKPLYNALHRIKEFVKGAVLQGNMFDDMGFYYLGPVDGHNIEALTSAIEWARDLRMPVLLHVLTQKGRGYPLAELQPDKYHGVGPFDPAVGLPEKSSPNFADTMGAALCELAQEDNRICALTAAMCLGTGLSEFARRFPERFHDAGIAEGHTVTMAAGMAKQGALPVAAIYSTFLQRSFDMLIHDLAIQRLHGVICIDRAGLVGEDGETHHGIFDLAYMSAVPGMVLWAPASFAELRDMLRAAIYDEAGPVSIRYPRGGEGAYRDGGAETCKLLREGADLTIVAYGTMINEALTAADELKKDGISAEVIKPGRLLPLDTEPILRSVTKTGRLICAEEVCAASCVGERLLAACAGITVRAKLLNLGEGIIQQGKTTDLRRIMGIDAGAIERAARELM